MGGGWVFFGSFSKAVLLTAPATAAAAGNERAGPAAGAGARLSSPALRPDHPVTTHSIATSCPCPSEQTPERFVYVVTIETLQITMAAFASHDTYFLFYVGVKN